MLMDKEDILKYSAFPMSVHSNGKYIRISFHGRRYLLHRLIMGAKDNEVVDHINGDTLDNRRENLRICTRSQNLWNMRGRGTSYKGVSFDKENNKWKATIQVNKRSITIGRFKSELDAAIAYNEAALLHHGEFAYMNKIGNLDEEKL